MAIHFLIATAMLLAAQTTPIISEIGMYHGSEWREASTNEWLALVDQEATFSLRSTTVNVNTVEDGIVDDVGEKTGKDVTVDLFEPPLFIFSNIPNLKPGPVQMLDIAYRPFSPGDMIVLAMGPSRPDRIEIRGQLEDSPPYDRLYTEYSVTLVGSVGNEVVRQELVHRDVVSADGQPSLLCAGDLDRDGKVDLIIDLTDHYNVRHLALFLSSYAKEGQLVGLVAELRTTGC